MHNKIIFLTLLLSFSCKTPQSGVNQMESIQEESRTVNLHHQSQNSLDWTGIYEGVLPCADCEGIRTVLFLKESGNYQKTSYYLGKSASGFVEEGIFKWLPDGNRIQLTDNENTHTYFKVEENQLRLLDQKGNPIESDSKMLLLTKKPPNNLMEKYWMAIELMGENVEMQEGIGNPPHLIIKQDGTFTGNGGCNSFFGTYEIEKKSWIRFTEINMTEMSCDFESYDEKLREALSMTQQFQLTKDGRMQLIVGKRAPLAIFKKVEGR